MGSAGPLQWSDQYQDRALVLRSGDSEATQAFQDQGHGSEQDHGMAARDRSGPERQDRQRILQKISTINKGEVMNTSTEYKGVKINVDIDTGEWRADVDGEDMKAETLAIMKQKIDTAQKKEFKRIAVFKKTGSYSVEATWREAEITSVNRETGEAWIVDAKKERSKVGFRFSESLAKKTPENEVLVEKINGLIKEKQRIENEIRANEKKLDMMTGKDIGYNPKY